MAPAGGIADKSLRAIAAAARTSHRMLIHHFGSRAGQHAEDSFGIFMLVQSEGADEKQNASRLTQHTGFAIIALRVSASPDEFAIGFSISLSGLA